MSFKFNPITGELDMVNDAPAASTEFLDTEFRIKDDGDETKKIAFEASTIAAATTRTITMPDADIDLTPDSQFIGTFANKNLSNLTATSIPTDLIPNGARDLGQSFAVWDVAWAKNFNANPGSTNNTPFHAFNSAGGTAFEVRSDAPAGVTPSAQAFMFALGSRTAGADTAYYTINTGTTVDSGDMSFETGNVVDGASGDFIFRTGVPSGIGTRGDIFLDTSADRARLSTQPTGAVADAIATTQYADSAGANTTLSNLDSPTEINQHLLPGISGNFNIGGAGAVWNRGTFNDIYSGAGNTLAFETANRRIYNGNGQLVADFGADINKIAFSKDLLPVTANTLNIGTFSVPYAQVNANLLQAKLASTSGNVLSGINSTSSKQVILGIDGTLPSGTTSELSLRPGVSMSVGINTINVTSANDSKDVNIETGNVADGISGDINLRAGVPSGTGTRGKIKLSALMATLPTGTADPTGVGEEAGDCYFDATTDTLRIYNGTTWVGVTLT